MWRLYQTATKTSTRPSALLDIGDAWAALQLDNAVVLFGTWVENAAQEMEKRGPESAPRWEPKYSMAQLLTPGFTLPTGQEQGVEDLAMFRATDGMKYDEVGP